MRALLLTCALLVSGCAALGLATPTSTTDTIGYAYSGVASAYTTLAQLASTGQIGKATATQAYNAIGVVKASLDQAIASSTSSAPVALTIITSATQTLASITAFLTCEQQKGTTCQL